MVDGYTVSDERNAEGAAQLIDATASIPNGTGIDIIVNQTTDGGLSLSETVSLSNGANAIDLSNFDDASGSYYIRAEFTGLDPDLGLGNVTVYVETDAGAERKTITWSVNEDWVQSTTADGVVYEDTPNTDHTNADTVKRGYAIADPTPANPFMYYPMHENSGSTAYDFGTNDTNAEIGGGVNTGVTGLIDTTAYEFNSEYVTVGSTIPDSVVLLPASDDLTHFSGDTGSFVIDDTSPVLPVGNNNDLSLKSSGSGERVIGSNSGLDNYPSTDTEFELSVYVDNVDSTAAAAYYTCSGLDPQNTDSGYGVAFRPDNSDIGVFRRDSGNFSSLDLQNYDWNTGWYTFNLLHESDGSITWSATEVSADTVVASGTPSDSTYITGGAFDYDYLTYRVVSDNPTLDLWYQPNE